MNNYEKAKEEGIKNFRELEAIAWRFNPLEPIYADENKKDLAYLEAFLSSFAEKIKEGVEKDNKYTISWDVNEKNREEWYVLLWKESEYEGKELILKLDKNSVAGFAHLSHLSDSQTIKE